MTLIQLKYFLAVADHQHVGKAAIESTISTSAISHSISTLESELNCKLVRKQGRQIQLTEEGKRLAKHAEKILSHAKDIRNDMLNDTQNIQGHYRLAATHGYCSNWLAPAWMNIQKKHANLSAEIFSFRSHDITQKISSGELDFGICISPHDSPAFNQMTLLEDQLVIAYRKNHPATKHDISVDSFLKALEKYPAAFPKSFHGISNCESHAIFDHLAIKPVACLLYDSYDVAIYALNNSDYWTLIPRSAIPPTNDKIDYMSINHPSLNIKVCGIWGKNQTITGALSLIISTMSQALQNK